MQMKRLWIVALLGLGVVVFFGLDLGRFLSLEVLKSRQADLAALYREQPWAVAAAFLAAYVAMTATSLPGAVPMTLAAGAIFGLPTGTLIASFASSIGALLAFLSSRYVLADWVRARLGTRLADIDRGMARDGAFYLFTLRLVPLVPFFAVNLLMGLTRMKSWTFYWVSQVGMLLGTAVYVNAGTQLAAIQSPRDIVSPALLGSFVLLGVFPLVARKMAAVLQARKVYARWAAHRPRRYDRNLVVIGAGASGLVASYIAAAVKARVTLVEAHKMGGDCLNYGCVPSKALIKTATLLRQMRHSADYGIAQAQATVDFAQVMERVARVVKTVEPHDSVERYTALGVDVVAGHARIVNPWTVQIACTDGSTQTLTTRSIVIATGAAPFVPPLPGLAEVGCLTSDTLWGLRELPRRLVVLGGGPIGCELAQCFARLGSLVTQVEMAPRLLVREDGTWRRWPGRRCRKTACWCSPATRPCAASARARARARASSWWWRRPTAPGASSSTSCCARWGAWRGCRVLAWRNWASRWAARWRPTSTWRRSTPTSWPRATWPAPTSSRTRRRTRPGMRR